MIFWSSFPFVRLVIPFGVGVLLTSFLPTLLTSYFNSILVLLALLFLGFHFFNKHYRISYFSGILASILFCVLGFTYTTIYNRVKQVGVEQVPDYTTWLGEVQSVKYKDGNVQSLIVEVEKYEKDASWVDCNFKLLVYNKDSILEARVGDVLSAKSKLSRTREPQNPAQFNYKLFLQHKNILLTTFEDQFVKLGEGESILRYAETARSSVINIYKDRGIENQNLAVLIALTLGDKSYLDFELKQQYAGAGAMHILAVSGLHVGIVFLLFNFLLSKLPEAMIYRILKAIILLLVIWSFAFLAGLSPSVQRAGWMFSFVILSKLVNRNSNIVNSIAVSAFLLLLIDPNNLFQVGFQLSYSAVIGIVLMHPPIYKLLYFKTWLLDKVWSLLVVSLVAQIATLPFTLAYFHQFPNYFLIANLFVIPLAFGIVSGAIIIVLLSFIFGFDFYLSTALDFLLLTLNYVIAAITSIPGAISQGIWLHSVTILFLVSSIITFCYLLYFKKVKSFLLLLIFLVGIQSVQLFSLFQSAGSKQLTFYSLSNPTWSVVDGLKGQVYLLEDGREYDRKMVEDHLNSLGVNQVSWNVLERKPNQVLNVAAVTILLLPDKQVYQALKDSVDYVVIGSQGFEYSGKSSIVLDYTFNYSKMIELVENRPNYYNLRKGNAFVNTF